MRRTPSITAVVALIAVTSCCAQKVIVDPNVARPGAAAKPASRAERYDPANDPDKRMARKVSYEVLHARLSAVTNGLTQASGVGIVCGRSKNDWPTRDIPVTMYAKDVPLGVLLRAIARATHNIVKAEKLNGRTVYRLCQESRLARAFAGYDKARKAYRKARLSYDWDLAVAFKDIPGSDLNANANYRSPLNIEFMGKLSGVLADLGPEHKQRLTSGEPITIPLKSLPVRTGKPLLDAYGQLKDSYNWDGWSSPVASNPTGVPTAIDELDNVTVTLLSSETDDDSGERWGDLRISVIGSTGGLGMTLNSSEYVKPDKLRTSSLPKPPTPPRITDDSPYDVDFQRLQEQQVPALTAKLDMDDLASKQDLNYAAVMKEMAKRSGFSFVVEDWDYSKRYFDFPREWLNKGVQLDKVLLHPSYTTRVDPRDKVIVTLVADWPYKHWALAPASLIDGLVKKLAADGVDLDDMLPVMCLTFAQWNEWVQESKNLYILTQHLNAMSGRDPMWKFFGGLTPADRAVAASPDGLSLAGFDPAVMADVMSRYRAYLLVHSSPNPKLPETLDERRLSQLALHLRSDKSPFNTIPEGRVAPKGIDVTYRYELNLSRDAGGARQQLCNSYGPSRLPFYSEAREAELIRSLTAPARIKQPLARSKRSVSDGG